MNLSLREKKSLLSSLTSGIIQFKFDNKLYNIHQPDHILIQGADDIYNNIILDNKFEGWLGDEDIEQILIQQGLWDRCNDITIKRLSETLDNYRVDLYNLLPMPWISRTRNIKRMTMKYMTA